MNKALFMSTIILAAPTFAAASIFDRNQAQLFRGVCDTAVAEDYLSDQEQAGHRINAWWDSGRFTRVASR